MLSEVNIAGIYVAPIAVYALAALPITLVLRVVFFRTGLRARAWHPALFELAVYVIVLALLILLV